MNLFVDTSVWSLALRCDNDSGAPEVARLREALRSQESIVTTGLVFIVIAGHPSPSALQRTRRAQRPSGQQRSHADRGVTSVGRAAVSVLDLNRERLNRIRSADLELGRHPPEAAGCLE